LNGFLFSFGHHECVIGIIFAKLWKCSLSKTLENLFFTCQNFWDVGNQKGYVVEHGIWT
jgi:hypothetical protein